MATRGPPLVPMGDAELAGIRPALRPWRKALNLSRLAASANQALAQAGHDRGPWLVVAMASGIACWFALPLPWQWLAAITMGLLLPVAAHSRWRGRDDRSELALAAISIGIAFSLGVSMIWARSELIGAEPISAPRFGTIEGRVLAREELPGDSKVRLTLAMRDAGSAQAIKVRINLKPDQDLPGLTEGAVVQARARLMPPAPPLVPGAYDFARRAWFDGLAATGSAIGPVELVSGPPPRQGWLRVLQRDLSHHIRVQIHGPPGSIAATLASGDRGAIAPADENAMRDAGLTHLLSISGVHVSALMALAYAATFRLLALWPWLALRWRLPIVAGIGAALAGIGYTLLTGAEVPTVRSCIGALLVLVALIIGRDPLSLRLVAVAAAAVLFLWPETLIGPSFQMSFAAVLAIVSLHQCAPVQRFLAPREGPWWSPPLRRLTMLLLTGVVIELTLMPIIVFHFHRAGLYGALANVVAIPLVSLVTMPLLAAALLLDIIGLGAPFWWATGQSIDALLGLARVVASAPHAVRLVPEIGSGAVLLFVAGALWVALWHGKVRLFGFAAIVPALLIMWHARAPDILVARDGRDMALLDGEGRDGRLILLREGDGESYTRETLTEISARSAQSLALENWPRARCSEEFCSFAASRGDRQWTMLVARGNTRVEERALAAACERVDIVIASRWLPRSCQPRWLKADGEFLAREGGLAIDLENARVDTVARHQGEHGWWRAPRAQDYPRVVPAS